MMHPLKTNISTHESCSPTHAHTVSKYVCVIYICMYVLCIYLPSCAGAPSSVGRSPTHVGNSTAVPSFVACSPGGALRLKRCVIDSPCSPSAAVFCFATFFSWWCFLRPALDSFEPPFLLPLALMARLPALLLGITSYILTIKLAYGTGELVDMGVSDQRTTRQNARNSIAFLSKSVRILPAREHFHVVRS